MYSSESKVLQYFCNVKHSSGAMDSFAEDDSEMPKSPLYGLKNGLGIHGFKPDLS